MSGRLNLLAGLLAAQLLVIAALVTADLYRSSDPAAAFIEVDPALVDGLEIGDAEGVSVALSKTDDAWAVGGLPADADKIGKVIDKLANATAAWPVATSEDARSRFEVTDAKHQRHIRLLAGGEPLAEVFLGTSPGYRRVHARAAGSDDVYSIDLATYEVPADADDWLDKALLGASAEVTGVRRVGAWALTRGEEGWLLASAAADAAPDATAPRAADQGSAGQMAERFEDLRVLGLAPEDGAFAERARFVVMDAAGEHELVVWHDEGEDRYALSSSRVPGAGGQRFELATYVAEQMLVGADDLEAVEAAAGEGEAEPEPEQGE